MGAAPGEQLRGTCNGRLVSQTDSCTRPGETLTPQAQFSGEFVNTSSGRLGRAGAAHAARDGARTLPAAGSPGWVGEGSGISIAGRPAGHSRLCLNNRL